MRKVFLAGTLTVCLLFTGCGEDKNADTDTKSKLKTLDFQVNNTSVFNVKLSTARAKVSRLKINPLSTNPP